MTLNWMPLVGARRKRSAWHSVLVSLSLVLLAREASAKPLEQRIAPACVDAARELGPRIERALAKYLPSELEAAVAIDAVGAGYRVTVALRDAEQTRGATTIEAPTCEEAVDAADVVLTLALSEVKRSEAAPAPPRTESPLSAPSPDAAPFRSPATTPPSDRRALSSDRGPERATRLTLATGVDRGTLPQPTLTLAGALARSFGGLELAAIARYGLPVADERVETGLSESQRHDFGGLELRACRGLGQAIRVAGCAGTEVGAIRSRRVVQIENRDDVDTDQLSPRVSGVLAAVVAHRGGLIEPAVEVAGAALALGHQKDAPWLSLRVSAGAAIAF